jgi:uncharacterized protein RhaS with RHS repeats
MLTARDDLGNEWHAVYEKDRVIQFTDALGRSSHYEYDAADRLAPDRCPRWDHAICLRRRRPADFSTDPRG